MERSERAVELFNGGMNCTQSVLSAFGSAYGLDGETAMRLGAPFGGGIAFLQEVCGALTGAIMIVGLARGAGGGDRDGREGVNEIARAMAARFRELNGSILCRDLIEYDITTQEGLEEARSKNGFAPCAEYVRVASRILEEML
ncbi:MAG: C_GCAxxG_C_C family protein [Spirochaetes bacterium]|nr:C_GCAxxG_C_C family protein [Spirochaetota bacterium]